MADYQGPYSGAQVDAALKAAIELQPKVTKIDGKIEQLSKTVYVWELDGSEGGTFSQEEFDKMRSADIVVARSTDDTGEQQYIAERVYDSASNAIHLIIHTGSVEVVMTYKITILPERWQIDDSQMYSIPTKVSQLDNDSGFVSSDGLKTINGQSIVGSGNIEISGGEGGGSNIYTWLWNGNDAGFISQSEYDAIQSADAVMISLEGDAIYHAEKIGTMLQFHVILLDEIFTYTFEFSENGDSIQWICTTTSIKKGNTVETDPVFSASPAASITEEKKAEWDAKQVKLVSGTNIKTINGESILGSGNIEISGGSTSQTQEYAPLKYLENTGTQYIDTGLVLTQDDVITVDFEVPDSAASLSTDKILIDARDDNYGVRVSTWGDNKKWYVRFGHNSGATSAAQSAAIRKGSLTFSKSSLVVNGSTVISSLTFTAMPTATLKLFSGVTPAGAISAPSYARISSCKVARGSETILNLIPVQRTADGVLGMRDLVSGDFLTNAGTGTFGYELAPVAGEVTAKKYPSLTDEQKAAMQALMDDYYNNRGTFYYEFTHNRNAFTSGSQCYDSARGKFKQCCATFVQHLMMGRSINDFLGKTASTYSSKITKTDVSKFGYYFDFKYRKYLYGLTDTDENGETTYYGYVQPNADNFEGSYSYNSYYHPDSSRAKKQNFNGFCNANDMARELYEMGCEIPFSELEIGDIIFTYDNDMADNSSMFNFVAWRNIYHVGMVYDVKQIDASSKEIYYIECTSYFDTETRPIEKPFLSSSQMDLRFKAFKLTEDMAFCARMPSVFGYEPNVPDQITSSPTP